MRRVDGVYRPVGKPVIHTSMSASTPAGRLGGKILYYNNNRLFCGDNTEGVELDSEVKCVVVQGENEAIAMTAAGPRKIRCTGAGIESETFSAMPPVRLVASAANPVTAYVEKRTLSADFSDSRFSDRDAKTLAADLCAAYRHLCETASSAGIALQPALARYKLIDDKGNTVYVSPTVYLSHADGAQCAGYTELHRVEGKTVAGYTLEAHPWSLDVVLPPTVADNIARLDVAMTPLFHPFDSSLDASIIMSARSSTTDTVARIALPGFFRAPGGKQGASIVREAFARIDSLERRVASIHRPFDGNARSVRISLAPSADPMADTNAIKTALSRPVAATERTAALLDGGFTAQTVAGSGSALLWSGVTALRPAPPSPEIFAADKGVSSNWTATVAVRFAGNKGVTGLFTATGGMFRDLGAILSYPSADAEEISVCVGSGGKYYGASFPLTPDSSGRTALYMSPDLRPIELPEISAPMTFGYTDASVEMPGVVVFTSADIPLTVKGFHVLVDTCTALVGRQALNQAWDFGRSRFVAATPTAFLSLALAANGTVAVNKLSERGAMRRDAVAVADDGSIYMIFCDNGASGGIYKLTCGGRLEVFEIDEKYIALAWNSAFSELWALRHDGSCTVFGPHGAYLRDDIMPSAFICAGGEAFAICDEGPAELAAEELCDCRIAVEQEYDIAGFSGIMKKDGRRVANVRHLTMNIQGSIAEGEAVVTALRPGGDDSAMLRKVVLSGVCAGPVKIPLLTRLHRRLKLRLDATVGADFRLIE